MRYIYTRVSTNRSCLLIECAYYFPILNSTSDINENGYSCFLKFVIEVYQQDYNRLTWLKNGMESHESHITNFQSTFKLQWKLSSETSYQSTLALQVTNDFIAKTCTSTSNCHETQCYDTYTTKKHGLRTYFSFDSDKDCDIVID